MKVIKAPRGAGKSTEIIKLSAANDYPIVVSCSSKKENIRDLASRMGVHIKEIYTIQEVLDQRFRGKSNKPFLIDDCDEVLTSLLKNKVYGISTS